MFLVQMKEVGWVLGAEPINQLPDMCYITSCSPGTQHDRK